MSSTSVTVLEIVAYNGCLDPVTLKQTICPLTQELQEISSKAIDFHPMHAVHIAKLREINSLLKLHYCTCCNKPYVKDGFWSGDLCGCKLSANGHEQEITRRANLRLARDPRLDPNFFNLCPLVQARRLFEFYRWFVRKAMNLLGPSSKLFQYSWYPLLVIDESLAEDMMHFNTKALSLLGMCMILYMLQKELCSKGTDFLLTNVALEAFVDNEKLLTIRRVLEDDNSFKEYFSEQQRSLLFLKMCESLIKVLYGLDLDQCEAGTETHDAIKNIGNIVGTFWNDGYNSEFFWEGAGQELYNMLPETFVWIPFYGGNRESYTPPANLFANRVREN